MPNAEGRAATGRTPRKATAAAAAAAAAESTTTERHVRSPIERATAALEKAKTMLEKAKAKKEEFEQTRARLDQDIEDAQVEYDYAYAHPMLVKQRKEQEAAAEATDEAADTTAPEPSGEPDNDAETDERQAQGEAAAAIPDVFEQEPPAPTSDQPPFAFDGAPAAVPAQAASPFDTPQANVTRV